MRILLGREDGDIGDVTLERCSIAAYGTWFQSCQDGVVQDEQRAERRREPLTKDVIVRVSVEILDAAGETGLTFRALATRLHTGAGAIYHHVANKSQLLTAVTDDVVAAALHDRTPPAEPAQAVRILMLDVFDVFDAHPWVGTQLAAEPWQPAVLRVFDRVGTLLDALGVPASAQFDATSTLVHHVLGVAGQYAAAARLAGPGTDRSAFLGAVATRRTTQGGAGAFPFLDRVATTFADHDDRAQFRAGVDVILAGIATLR
ncbi:TetR/AcrR family transcriptional regulator [Curtobacterium sp. MCPF17_047]|nr:TetR/AcrR family transcriptional regulator [Curtobacterium sp. MCPF17_047]